MPNVLLVEDERHVVDLVEDALADAGFTVTVALDDRTAYSRLDGEARSFAALVTDIDLGPGTTGFDVARRARLLHPTIAVMYITGGAARVEKFGVPNSELFPKPFKAAELAARLSELLGSE